MRTPRHDPLPGGRAGHRPVERVLLERIRARFRRRGSNGGGGGEPCPVDPNRPLDLSGGAAAALEFDD